MNQGSTTLAWYAAVQVYQKGSMTYKERPSRKRTIISCDRNHPPKLTIIFVFHFLCCVIQMPAIHDFGLFMALIVGSCWWTVFWTIPPALNLWHRYVARWETLIFQFLFGWMSDICACGVSGLPGKYVLWKFAFELQDESERIAERKSNRLTNTLS